MQWCLPLVNGAMRLRSAGIDAVGKISLDIDRDLRSRFLKQGER
jgi:hypothetical protein